MAGSTETIFNSSERAESMMSTTSNEYGGTVNTSAVFDSGATENSTFSTMATTVETMTLLGMTETGVLKFSSILRTYVMPAIGIVGLIGNCFGVSVLRIQARQQKMSIFWYLLALTSIDIVFLACAIIDGISFNVKAFDKQLSKYLVAHFRLGLSYIDVNCIHTARYFVVVMSCERLISVVRPFQVKETWFAKHPKRISIACLLFNAIFLLPVPINATVVQIHSGNNTDYAFTYKNYENFMAPWWVVEAVVHSFIPMAILVPVNLALPIFFYRMSKKLRASKHQKENSLQGKITATVLVITINYVILSIPLTAAKWFQFISPEYSLHGRYRLVFWFFANVGKCLAYINAANDFLIFFLLSKDYRAAFMTMYCRRWSRKPSQKYREGGGSLNRPTTSRNEWQAGSQETFASTISG